VTSRALPWALVAGALVTSARSASADEVRLKVGSKRFTESYILAEIGAAVAREGGDAKVSHEQGLGGTALVFGALQQGSIDVYPEYTGTIVEAILHGGDSADLGAIRRALAAKGIGVGEPLGFSNTYALAVSKGLAGKSGLSTISDLARQPALRFGLSHEFIGRADGWPGLSRRYGLERTAVRGLDHGLAYEAIADGSIDVTDVYSTDAKIKKFGLVVLGDDKRFFPAYEAVFLYRLDVPARAPRAFAALSRLSGRFDAATMIDLNARAELEGQTFASVGAAFVRDRFGAAGAAGPEKRPGLARGIAEVIRAEGPRHVGLVAASLLLSTLVGVPLGVLATRRRRLGQALLSVTGVIQTVPSLALLCFLIPLFGTGALPALLALFLYGLLPIARNTVAGIQGIAPSLLESAAALGLSERAQLLVVRLPLASRTILAGIRTCAVVNVGTATLAAFIGAGGFGAPISVGLNLNDTNLILQGAIPAALLAVLAEGLFGLLDRWVIPRGLRLGDGAR
jgi:osmoprotectant transport system permease protein